MNRSKAKLADRAQPVDLRIIGGKFRGHKLRYHGDPSTRPMKERVREAIFNLISTEVAGRHAIDLFAGTGALGLEALSRGAISATLVEKHVPTARVIQENVESLQCQDRVQSLTTSAFLWAKRDLPNADCELRIADVDTRDHSAIQNPKSKIPWLVFCSPPYAFYAQRQQEMLQLIDAILEYAPTGSILVVESDERFHFTNLPGGIAKKRKNDGWDVRSYPPAVVGVLRMKG